MSLVPLSNFLVRMAMQGFTIRQVQMSVKIIPYRRGQDKTCSCCIPVSLPIQIPDTTDLFAENAFDCVNRVMELSKEVIKTLHVVQNEGNFFEMSIKSLILVERHKNTNKMQKLEIKSRGSIKGLSQLITKGCEGGHQPRLLEALSLDAFHIEGDPGENNSSRLIEALDLDE